MDTTQTERLLSEDCVHFLNSILADLEDPYGAGMNNYYSDEQLGETAYALTGALGLTKDGADAFECSG